MEETKETIERKIAVTEILRKTLGWWGASGATRNCLGVDSRTDKSGAVLMEMLDRGLLKETISCEKHIRYFRATVLGQERAERVCPRPIVETVDERYPSIARDFLKCKNELAAVDEVLARRKIIDDKPDRISKILGLCEDGQILEQEVSHLRSQLAQKIKIHPRAGNCGLCAHWGQKQDLQFGDCRTANIVRREWGPGIEFHEIAPDCAVVENDEGWGICTGIMFGCVHWEGRD